MTKKVLKSWYSLLNTEGLEFEWGRDDESLDWHDKDCGLHIVIDGEKFYKSAFDEFEKSTQEVVENMLKFQTFVMRIMLNVSLQCHNILTLKIELSELYMTLAVTTTIIMMKI